MYDYGKYGPCDGEKVSREKGVGAAMKDGIDAD